jgi:hypothetical protein
VRLICALVSRLASRSGSERFVWTAASGVGSIRSARGRERVHGHGAFVKRRSAYAWGALSCNLLVPAREGSPEQVQRSSTAPLTLDFARDERALAQPSVRDAIDILIERHGIGPEAARATAACNWTLEMRRAYVGWLHRNELDDEQFRTISAILDDPEPVRWKLHHESARKLRELTGRPFSELKPLVEQIDKELMRLPRDVVYAAEELERYAAFQLRWREAARPRL